MTRTLFRCILWIIILLIICQNRATYALCEQSIHTHYGNNQRIRYLQKKGQIELRYGVSTGFLTWKTSAYSEYWGEVASELNYFFEKTTLSLLGKYNFASSFMVALSFELGEVTEGTSIDTDWLLSTSQDPWMKTRQPFDGQTYSSFAKIFYRILGNSTTRFELNFFLGYHTYKFFGRMIDPVTYEIIQYESADDTVRVGLDSTYEIIYEGFKCGLEGGFYFLPQIFLRGNIDYSPNLKINADGYWNLRNMTFIQSGTGDGIEGEVSLNYSLTPSWQIVLTYRLVTFDLKKGSFINKFPESETGYGDLNSTQIVDKTILIGGTYKF